MSIRPIRNDCDLQVALARVDQLFGAPEGTEEGDELEVLVALIKQYEDERHAIAPPHPIEAIK